MSKKLSIRRILGSGTYALQGIRTLLTEESNAWIHTLSACMVVVLGFVFKVSSMEWVAIVFAIGFVFTAEQINTAVENLCDFISPDKHSAIKKIKDLAAAAVLVSAFTAVVIGLIVFIPKLI